MGSAGLHYIPRKGEQNVKVCYILLVGCDILKKKS